MKNGIDIVLLCLIFGPLFGCDAIQEGDVTTASESSVASPTIQKLWRDLPEDRFPRNVAIKHIGINGWDIEYPNSFKSVKIYVDKNTQKIEFEDLTIQITDDQIYVGESLFGEVTKGSHVIVGFQGDIAVNGVVRKPTNFGQNSNDE